MKKSAQNVPKDDLIFRKAAIEGFFALDIEIRPSVIDAFLNMIMAISSEEPGTDEWCTDCKEYDAERNCCPRYGRVIKSALECLERKWIPCSERLPEKEGWYLISVKTGNVTKAFYRVAPIKQGGCYWRGHVTKPTAWMELPEPWEGEQNE